MLLFTKTLPHNYLFEIRKLSGLRKTLISFFIHSWFFDLDRFKIFFFSKSSTFFVIFYYFFQIILLWRQYVFNSISSTIFRLISQKSFKYIIFIPITKIIMFKVKKFIYCICYKLNTLISFISFGKMCLYIYYMILHCFFIIFLIFFICLLLYKL